MKFRDGISIIVTVYNKEQFISKTLETISKQMSGNSQLIIINDGSTDKSELVIKKFIKSQNKDIKYIKQKNAGPSKAVNSAFKFVKYTYLKFVDGDDIIAPDALLYMKKEMEKLDLDLLYGHWGWEKNINNFKFKKDNQPAFLIKNPVEKFLPGGWGGSSNSMIKSSVFKSIGGCDDEVFVQDFSLPMRVAGFHLKNKGNKKFKIGQSQKLMCVAPEFIENRIISNNGQLLYDLSIATINFLENHKFVKKSLVKKCKIKILSRCWSWQRRHNKVSVFNRLFLTYLNNRILKNVSLELLKLTVFDTWKGESLRKIKLSSRPKKILIYVGLDLLGDALLKFPFLKHLKDIFPQSEIVWKSGKGYSIFKRGLKPLTEKIIHSVDEREFGSSVLDFFKIQKFDNYDIVIDTQKRFLTTLLLKAIPTKIFISSSANYLLSDFVPSNRGEKNLTKQLINLANVFSPEKFKESLLNKSNTSRKVVICPGASVNWKMWDINNFLKVGLFIKEKKHIPIFILGPKEKRLYSILKKKHFPGLKIVETNNPLKTINISKDCKFGIANDTGCGHLIANSGIPLISLFGPTNHHKFAPIGNSKNTVISSQDLYKNNNINMIKTADVIETIKRIID